MTILSTILIGLVALIHLYILWFEMFAWESRGPKVFRGFQRELFTPSKAMAANQGLYNGGFLAAGLIWTFFISNLEWKMNVSIFFLACVAVAGIYGAYSADKNTLRTNGSSSTWHLCCSIVIKRSVSNESYHTICLRLGRSTTARRNPNTAS